eukprot:6194083-Pleurochrysis_carterae.AAC.2
MVKLALSSLGYEKALWLSHIPNLTNSREQCRRLQLSCDARVYACQKMTQSAKPTHNKMGTLTAQLHISRDPHVEPHLTATHLTSGRIQNMMSWPSVLERWPIGGA